MIKTKEFSMFGRRYRTTQFAAIPALDIMDNHHDDPVAILAKTASFENGHWMALNTPEAINALVHDELYKIAPRMALNGLMSLVGEFSFGFLHYWRGAKVPSRFSSGSPSISSNNIDPTVGTLITEGLASMKELEEYYSLEDAYKMFDALIVKNVNSALSQEAATSKPKK